MTKKILSTYFDEDEKAMPWPTHAPPGSLQKQIVFAVRVWSNQELHHPMDVRRGIADETKNEQLRALFKVAKSNYKEIRERVPEITPEVFAAYISGRLSLQVLDELNDEE